MDAKKNKMCKVRLRRLRPELMDKLKTKRFLSRTDVNFSSSSSSSESDDDEASVVEKISVTLSKNKDFDPFILLSEAQQILNTRTAKEAVKQEEAKVKVDECDETNSVATTSASNLGKSKKKKHSKYRSHYYPSPLENSLQRRVKLMPSLDGDPAQSSDREGACNFNCNHMQTIDDCGCVKTVTSPTRRSSTGSSSSLVSDNCSMRFSKLFGSNCISVMDDENPPTALSKILAIKEFDPLAPQQLVALIIKSIVSLAELSQREDNIINMDIDKRSIVEFASLSQEGKKNCRLNPFMDVCRNIVVTHPEEEFFTFCLCKNCEEYRELVIHIMVEQFKAAHMVVMLLDVLIKAYGPMLKNITAYNKFEKLLDSNKEIYWITCGVIYHKKGEHLDFIYDEYLSDNMIFVLFSSILMLNNPLLLLQILAFHVECIVKAYAEGFLEIVEPDQSKIPADEMINYILNGYEDLIRISEQVASYLFAFENDFLRKFSMTWKLLCQRLYQQHVHLHLADTMLACIITLKEEELTSHHTDLIKRYIQFDDIMNYVEKRWTDVWIELNKFNLSEVERKRRKSLLDVYRIFDTVVQDAIAFSLQDSVDDNDFYDFRSLKNRRLAWKNIMSYTKMKWPDGFYQPPNTLVVDDKCNKCNVSLEYHVEYCKCITCSIAGGPLPPRRNADGKCSKCLSHEIVEKDVNFYDSKIVNVCASDDFQNLAKNHNGAKRKNTALQEVGQELYSTLASVEEMFSNNGMDLSQEDAAMASNAYHISWAVFNHLNNRKRFVNTTIEEHHFCKGCKMASCQLACKILNNEISPSLSQDLIHYYQPMSMSREELRSILPNIMLYNRKLVASNNGLDLIDVHDLVVKIYWIFIISVYAIYFIDFNDNKEGQETPLNLEPLELINNDISVKVEKIVGNKDDTKFLEFLDKIKSLSPYNNDVESNFDAAVNIDSAEIQKKLNDILKISECQETSQCENIPPPIITPTEEEEPMESNPTSAVESQPKKTCTDKSKKCCFDHSDIGEHCKENHSNKKRIKKDCNHARMNETRDRLRKKLSQIVNARKNSKTSHAAAPPAAAAVLPDAQHQMENVLNADELKLFQQFQQQLPQSASWDAHAIAATFEQLHEAKRNEKLHDLCECLQHLQTNQKNDSKANNKKPQHKQTQQKPLQTSLEPPNKKSNMSNSSTRDASTSSQGARSKEHNNMITGSEQVATVPITAEPSSMSTPPPPPPSTTISAASKSSNNLDFVTEICEIIDNYSKEQAKRKWIKETLSFIEGPDIVTGKKKTQPQTLNPKKAAKKAKQKQRKEEEKRITELQDLRGQFHNIYFKEFTEKLTLKSLKANKKRDKKKIGELESNIKNLQRAKAKVETAILELIATVKQTSAEFKFPYLPTKEQQIEKVKELEGQNTNAREHSNAVESKIKATHQHQAGDTIVPSTPFSMTQTNNLNMVPDTYSMPYAHANHFPYNLGFPPPAAPAPFGLMRATPMCYAPPPSGASAVQQQPLGAEMVAAMAAGANSNSSDPSKRIVTIRRVNLPNVPEPQVTVTAKGSSPDKDKLLYTFINGQLVQTSSAPTQSAPVTTAPPPVTGPLTKLSPELLLTLPPPPPPKLSKTQIKKERRRLAKIQAEAEALAEAERKRLEEEQQKLRILEEQKQLELLQQQQLQQQKQKQSKKKKKLPAQQTQASQSAVAAVATASTNKGMKQKNKPNKLVSSNSTTSVSTNENSEPPSQLPQMMMQKNLKQKRSVSTTTSCSAVTTSSSNNSISSQVNTRDNSVSSLKPANPKSLINKKNSKEMKIAMSANSLKNKSSNGKSISQKKPPPPSSSTVSSEDEDTVNCAGLSSAPPLHKLKNQCKSKPAPHKIAPANQRKVVKPKTPTSSDTECEKSEQPTQLPQAPKVSKKKRSKLVDNGQFDNNPFKSLHMQDSETESYSSDEDDANRNDCELESQVNLTANTIFKDQPLTTMPQIKESKTNKPTTKKLNKVLKKKSESESHEMMSQTSRDTGGKDALKQQQKFKTQLEEKVSTTMKQQKEDHSKRSSNQRLFKETSATTPHPLSTSNNRKIKGDNRSIINNQPAQNTKMQGPPSVRTNSSGMNTNLNRAQSRNNARNSNKNHNGAGSSQQYTEEPLAFVDGGESKNKRSQRNNKKYQQKPQKSNQSQHQNCCSGIPNNMGYFNPNEVNINPNMNYSMSAENVPTQNRSYQSLAEQMQALHLSGGLGGQHMHSSATTAQQRHHIITNNVSIMDQLNRGVQVENLSLPPGITLTKVDPIKSEQLRQKSESIKKLAKPLQQQHQHISQTPQAFHHPAMGTTIFAPPVTPMSNYYNSPYAGNVGIASTTALDLQSGTIMVEANPSKCSTTPSTSNATSGNNKQSKNKKRRNKSKINNNVPCGLGNSSGNVSNLNQENNITGAQPKMITLRNPMFHGGPTTAAPATILQPPPVAVPSRPLDPYHPSASAPVPVDQPAAIIKNENGMYTIRNPALHQAVTNGLVLGGYRQFGNVSYYTPQEAAAEAAKATQQQQLQQQQQQQQQQTNESSKTTSTGNMAPTSFSYFSNDTVATNASHNNISISCTSVSGGNCIDPPPAIGHQGGVVCGLTGDAAVIQRPAPAQKCISAIGSEIKSAQQQKQKSKEQHWSHFGTDALPLNKSDNVSRSKSFLGSVAESTSSHGVADINLQEKYQQSKYYNGFDVFPGSSGGSNSSANTGGHIHHSCGDDSPPPSISGYNSYLDGIPNTGIIRYDDASFLKNLIPGQNLNNEVSIHNVNDSNFVRNAHSPQAHRVEITPVYRPPSTNMFEANTGPANQASFRGNYRDQLGDYNSDSNLFSSNNLHLNLTELESSIKYDFEPPTSVANAASSDNHNSILNLNELLSNKNGPAGPASHRASDENTLEGFVQNMNSLHISSASTAADEQSSQLNGSGIGHTVTTSANVCNGWW